MWKKLGQIYNPTIIKLNDNVIRVFYSGRDKQKRSSLGAFDFNMYQRRIEKDYFEPFITHGGKNSFFEDGISVGCAIEINSIF